jgi:cytochrome c
MRIKIGLWIACAAAISLLYTMPVASDTQLLEIARKAGCMACHAIDRKVIGPAFGWVAYKYRDDKEKGRVAVVHQIANGGSRQWIIHTGGISMPPMQERMTEEQRIEFGEYILNLAPSVPPASRSR